MKTQKTIVIEDEEEEEDLEFMEQQKLLMDIQHEKEVEEENKFQALCSRVMNGFNLLNTSFTDLIELKDELVEHNLPPKFLLTFIVTIGKMFRGLTDMENPLCELTRLVKLFSIPWKQRSVTLKKLHEDNEAVKRELDISLRKLNIMSEKLKKLENEKAMMNWEKIFTKITLGKAECKKWKFNVRYIRKQLSKGVHLSKLKKELINDSENSQQSLNMYSTFSPEFKHNDIDSPEEINTSKQLERPHLFLKKQNAKPACEDKSVWTAEKNRNFVVRIYNLKYNTNSVNTKNSVSCIVKYGNQQKETDVFNDKTSKKLPTTEVIKSSITKRETKKKEKSSWDQNKPSLMPFNNSFHEVIFDYEDADQNVEIKLNDRKAKGIIGSTTVKKVQKNCVFHWENEGVIDEKEVEEFFKTKKPLYCSVKNTSKRSIYVEELTVLLYTTNKLTHKTISCNTLPINHVISQITGIDLDKTTKKQLQYKLKDKKTQDAYTSPILYEPESQVRKDIISNEEVDTIKIKHKDEMRQIHEDYECKMKKLINDLDELRQKQCGHQNKHIGVRNEISTPSSGKISKTKNNINKTSKNVENSLTVSQFKWGDDLPKNVWERMKILTDEMVNNRQKVENKIRKEIADKIHKNLASQYRLHRDLPYSTNDDKEIILPAVFMPTGNLYSSNARSHFHDGSRNPRITQPPSVFQLPPLHENSQKSLSTLNLFELNRISKSQPVQTSINNLIYHHLNSDAFPYDKDRYRANHTSPVNFSSETKQT